MSEFDPLIVDIDDADLAPLLDVLGSQPDCARLFGKMLFTGGGLTRVDAKTLGTWLLARTRVEGSAEVAAQLHAFLADPKVTLEVLVALQGTEVDAPLAIFGDVEVVRPDDVEEPEFIRTQRSMRERFRELPTVLIPDFSALLRKRITIDAIPEPTTDAETHGYAHAHTPVLEATGKLYELALALTLVGPHSPVAVANWTQAASWVPLKGLGGGTGSQFVEIEPRERRKLTPADDLSPIGRYLALDAESRKRLRIPLHRLNLALRRSTVGDMAIELGIALESLLVAREREHDVPLSFSLRLHGARLERLPVEVRRQRFKLLGQAYRLRSKAVHGEPLDGGDREALDQAAQLCAKLVDAVMSRPAPIDWTDVELGAD